MIAPLRYDRTTMASVRIMVSRHSAFYSPLIGAIAGGFLAEEGLEATYGVLAPGQRSHELIRKGAVDIMQSAVSSNWKPMENGLTDLPAHFAQINRRDGFFIVARHADPAFDWSTLGGGVVLADHGRQPLLMFQYAAKYNGVDWQELNVIDRGTPEQMDAAFRSGEGDYVHLQGPAAQQLEHDGAGYVVASVGEAMPPVAFSSLCASRGFLKTDIARAFLRAYRKSREWAQKSRAAEIVRAESSFFPPIHPNALAAAVRTYQRLGCWKGDLVIPRNLYTQSLRVFAGEIARPQAYEDVVVAPPE
jgi:NitT/TauT family transport system substrate-binding protein